MIPRIITIVATVIAGAVVYASTTGAIYGTILAYIVIAATRRAWSKTRSVLLTASTAVGAVALTAMIALALNRYLSAGSHVINSPYFYRGMTSAGIVFVLALSAGTYHIVRMRYAALMAVVSVGGAVVLMLLSAPYGPTEAVQHGGHIYGPSQALVDERDPGDVAATTLLVYGLGLLLLMPLRALYLRLAPDSWLRKRTTPGETLQIGGVMRAAHIPDRA